MHNEQSIKSLCRLFGKTPHAYYKAGKYRVKKEFQNDKVLAFVRHERKYQPKIGVIKLQHMINQSDLGLTVGRDALYNLLREHRLLIRRTRKYRPKQTNGNGESIYPDLRKDLLINRINQLWSTDITYLELANSSRFCYLCCICDEASHMIVGHSISIRMRTNDILSGLEHAVENQLPKHSVSFNNSLIIHSDRGSQF
ncbi:MAG: DDE-type integrase/transposase/recombinase, partial [Flavobacteriaceae bacterium]|nr:DDE-type integrase/transposase/recombinase [Flavobacteriaceae bacterium]